MKFVLTSFSKHQVSSSQLFDTLTVFSLLPLPPPPCSIQFDREHFQEVFVDLKWFESKVGNKYLNEAAGRAAEMEAETMNKAEVDMVSFRSGNVSTTVHVVGVMNWFFVYVQDSSISLAALTGGVKMAEPEEEEDDIFETEFRQYKRTYYMTKMGVDVVSE